MIRFILSKLAYLIPTFLGITVVAFGFVRVLPGDPVLLMAGERGVSPERHAELMKQFGFDRPMWEQYLDYIWNVLHGDFGMSMITKKPVLTEFFTLFPATLELATCAILLAILIGIPAGVIAALPCHQQDRITRQNANKTERNDSDAEKRRNKIC